MTASAEGDDDTPDAVVDLMNGDEEEEERRRRSGSRGRAMDAEAAEAVKANDTDPPPTTQTSTTQTTTTTKKKKDFEQYDDDWNILFEEAVQVVRQSSSSSPSDSNNDDRNMKLRLYGLYKRVTMGGDVHDEQSHRPSILQPVARAKYDAWQACKTLSVHESQREYVDIVVTQVFFLPEDDDDYEGEEGDGEHEDITTTTSRAKELKRRYRDLLLRHDEDEKDQEDDEHGSNLQEGECQKEENGSIRPAPQSSSFLKEEERMIYSSSSPAKPPGTSTLDCTTAWMKKEERGGRLNEAQSSPSSQHREILSGVLHQIDSLRLYPRGTIDLTFRHWLYALGQACNPTGGLLLGSNHRLTTCRTTHRRYEIMLERLWKEYVDIEHQRELLRLLTTSANGDDADDDAVEDNNEEENVVVVPAQLPTTIPRSVDVLITLSVRSGFDLYLRACRYPPGSEILMCPGIQIPSMIAVAEYHGLVVIPVDFGSTSCEMTKEEQGSKEEGNDDDDDKPPKLVWPTVEDIVSRVTSRTVSIMIVHPFGMIGYGMDEMRNLRHQIEQYCIVQSHERNSSRSRRRIDILEDCAECYAGPPPPPSQPPPAMNSSHKNGSSKKKGGGTSSRRPCTTTRTSTTTVSSYHGSPYADVTFFSFGTIKTCTALGGGIVTIHHRLDDDGDGEVEDDNGKEDVVVGRRTVSIANRMKRLQSSSSSYPIQSNLYFCRTALLKSAVILLATSSTLIYGIIACLANAIFSSSTFPFSCWGGGGKAGGSGFHSVALAFTRGFPVEMMKNNEGTTSSGSSTTSSSTGGSANAMAAARRTFISHLRYRPSPSQMALLYHRLCGGGGGTTTTSSTVTRRIERCDRLSKLLEERVPTIQTLDGCFFLPSATGTTTTKKDTTGRNSNMYWLFPVVLPEGIDPDNVSRYLYQRGFDVPRGTSQLDSVDRCVTTRRASGRGRAGDLVEKKKGAGGRRGTTTSTSNSTTDFMSRVLYLPISFCNMKSSELDDMIDALRRATTTTTSSAGSSADEKKTTNERDGCSTSMAPMRRGNHLSSPLVFGLSLFVVLRLCGYDSTSSLVLGIVATIWRSGLYYLFLGKILFIIVVYFTREALAPSYLKTCHAVASHLDYRSSSSAGVIRRVEEEEERGGGAAGSNGNQGSGKTTPAPQTAVGDYASPLFRLSDVAALKGFPPVSDGGKWVDAAGEERPATDGNDCTVGSSPRSVILTGATGFVGSMLLRDLLRYRRQLLGSNGRVILFSRSRSGRTAKERIESLLQHEMFAFLPIDQREVRCTDDDNVVVQSGVVDGKSKHAGSNPTAVETTTQAFIWVMECELTENDLGLNDDRRYFLQSMNVSHIIHCAATVSFTQPLDEAAKSNITPGLRLQSLAKSLRMGSSSPTTNKVDCIDENNNRHTTNEETTSEKETKTVNDGGPLYVHISTAFVHGGLTGGNTEEEHPLSEDLFPLSPYTAAELYESMLESQSLASYAMKELGFPNTYTFSKCLCEHLLLRCGDGDDGSKSSSSNNTVIIRPSIVGPAAVSPYEGWGGNRAPSTLVAAACLYLKNQWSMWIFGARHLAVIPVDVVSMFTLCRAFEPAAEGDLGKETKQGREGNEAPRCSSRRQQIRSHDDRRRRKRIYNAAWDSTSPPTSTFTANQFGDAVVKIGSIQGYYSRFTAVLIHLVNIVHLPSLANLSSERYIWLHEVIVKMPLTTLSSVLQKVCPGSAMDKGIRELLRFVDLPVLFLPFSSSNFYFRSDLVAPESFIGERYMITCCLAADDFCHTLSGRRKERGNGKRRRFPVSSSSSNVPPSRMYRETVGVETDEGEVRSSRSFTSRVIGGERYFHSPGFFCSDFWWALTQPRGNLVIRAAGYLLTKLFRRTTSEITVDVASLAPLSRARQSHGGTCATPENGNDDGGRRKPLHVVLAPTHRSIYDFLLVSYVAFALPELALDIPYICADEEFGDLPFFGLIAQWARAFFVKRGRGKADPNLSNQVTRLKSRGSTSFEVFLEGKRSRDRRFVSPKRGFLRCLVRTGGDHLIVPICINYERVAEQESFANELRGSSRERLSITGLTRWCKSMLAGKIQLGRIHISAGDPLMLSQDTDLGAIAQRIQRQQQRMVRVSEYHVHALGKALAIPPATAETALHQIGCRMWPGYTSISHLTSNPSKLSLAFANPPESSTEYWSVLLQLGHFLSPLIAKTYPRWAMWLDPLAAEQPYTYPNHEPTVEFVAERLASTFRSAEAEVDRTLDCLRSKGFPSPQLLHVLQYIEEFSHCSPILAAVALSMVSVDESFLTCGDGDEKKDDHVGSFNSLNMVCSTQQLTSSQRFCPEPKNFEHKDESLLVESFGSWGFKDSGFILTSSSKGGKRVRMNGNRYNISGRELKGLVPFIEKEMKVCVDPKKIWLRPSNPDLDMEACEMSIMGIGKLIRAFGKHRVSTLITDRARHGTGHTQTDMCILRGACARQHRFPDVVIWPENESEVQGLVKLAREENWCLIPFGGGTNVSHATWCPSKEHEPRPIVSVDMKRMKRILEINEEDGVAHVEAGITGRELAEELEYRGFTCGHEPDSYEFSTLGGWVATKASGMKRSRYGNIEDIVKEVRIVGSNGLMWQHHDDGEHCFDTRSGCAAMGRTATGVELTDLMLGSEGCLGIVTSAILKVWPIAERKGYESVVFPYFGLGLNFVRAVSKLQQLKPASVRLVDNEQFRLGQVMKNEPGTAYEKALSHLKKFILSTCHGFDLSAVAGVTIMFEGQSDEVKLQRKLVTSLALQHGGVMAGSSVGKAGYDLTFAIAYLRDFAMTYYCLGESFETFLPWSKVEDAIVSTKERIRREHKLRWLPGKAFVSCRVTQLYDEGACVYFYFCMNVEGVKDASRVFSEIEESAREEILSHGGSLSHHHGCGKIRSKFMRRVVSTAFIDVMQAFKQSIDPNNVFGARNGIFGLQSHEKVPDDRDS